MSKNLIKALHDFESWQMQSKILISLDNFDTIFELWCSLVTQECSTQAYVQAFFEDLSNNAICEEKLIKINTTDLTINIDKGKYDMFWNQYSRPLNLPSIAAQKDRLVDLWERRKDGEFFTPSFYAKLAHQYLQDVLGDEIYKTSWWDMCCGTGNLTKDCPLDMLGRLYMSTLNEEDINILAKTEFNTANLFTHDFLNSSDNYEFLNSSKKWVFILNPPYSASPTVRDKHKTGVSDTEVGSRMKDSLMNKAASNLTTQFLWKIIQIAKKYNIEITVGMFTQIAFAMNPTYSQFYKEWTNTFHFKNGFCFHCSEFEGTTGEWPVVFSVWSTNGLSATVNVDIYENQKNVGEKSFFAPQNPLSKWVDRPKNIIDSVPLTSAITVATPEKTINLTKLPRDAMGFAVFAANDVMHSKQAYLLSAPYANGSGWGVTKQNWEESLVALGLRAIIKGTWLNDRDQFSVPDIHHEKYEQFKNDIIVWMLFSNFNHSASISAQFNNEKFDILNHFYWREGAVAEWLSTHLLDMEAANVLQHCNHLYDMLRPYQYLADAKYQLDRHDAGWYQWRKGLCGQNAPNQIISEMYTEYKKKHKLLTQKIIPVVYELGVLPKEMYFSKLKNSKQVRLHTKTRNEELGLG